MGNPSARVRDELWDKATRKCKGNGVTQIWAASNPQGFSCRQYGETSRAFVDYEGLHLVVIPREQESAGKVKEVRD